MQSNFQPSLAFVLKDEGGNDDDPADHGGRTSRGITQREYDAWRGEQALPTQDVWDAPQTEIDSIYYEEYWYPLGNAFPTGIDYLYFDMAVNAGPNRAAILLQRALWARRWRVPLSVGLHLFWVEESLRMVLRPGRLGICLIIGRII